MAHPLHFNSPSDLRRQARRARHRRRPSRQAMENPSKTLPPHQRAPETLRTRDPWEPALLQPLRELDGGHPLPRPARIRMPAASVAGRALRVPAGWAFGPPFPRPAAAGVAAVVEGSREVWDQHTTIGIPTPRGRDAHPTRAPPTKRSGTSIGPDDLADATAGAPRGGHLRLARRSYQIVSTRSSSVIFRSRVTSGSSNAIAVALMKRSHGSPSASRGIR